MIHSYVTSHLDNGNCLLYGISDHVLAKLQRVQNAAARFITKTKTTRPHHCCCNRSLPASDQTADRVQTVIVDVSKPSRTSCIIHNRPANSFRTDPCATPRGRPPAGGSTIDADYVRWEKRHFRVLLHASGTICCLPCVTQTFLFKRAF